MQLVRCASCRLIFEASSEGSLPVCRQCGAPTTALEGLDGVVQSAHDEEERKTQKLPIISIPGPLPRR